MMGSSFSKQRSPCFLLFQKRKTMPLKSLESPKKKARVYIHYDEKKKKGVKKQKGQKKSVIHHPRRHRFNTTMRPEALSINYHRAALHIRYFLISPLFFKDPRWTSE